MTIRERITDSTDNGTKTRCPYCGKFVSPNADGFYDKPDNFDFVVAFCSEQHADKFRISA